MADELAHRVPVLGGDLFDRPPNMEERPAGSDSLDSGVQASTGDIDQASRNRVGLTDAHGHRAVSMSAAHEKTHAHIVTHSHVTASPAFGTLFAR